MEDILIARQADKKDIRNVADKLGITEDKLILYGYDKAKLNFELDDNNFDSNMILVTAISPTPYGEGKTTVSIGLHDALCLLNKKSVAVLREPSMGPVFGMKGGATGGGYSQVIPMEDINLHFTGDFHAITAANNLLCSAIDNHIFHGNKLDINKVIFNRTLDVNDRALRTINLNNREEKFTITAACEIMALFCLANSLEDLRKRLGSIVIGYNSNGKMIYARDLGIEGSLVTLLKDAFKPNLVQTLEGNPVIIHGGPFANIAHGCNSIVASKYGMQLGDYVITEAGFGADLGAEKFYNIKCRLGEFNPKCTVLVVTIKALKYHGGVSKEEIYEVNNDALTNGFANLKRHYDNLKKFGNNVIVCLNKYNTDLDEEISFVREYCENNNMVFACSSAYSDGGEGAIDLANKVIDVCKNENDFRLLYEENIDLKEKISCVCKEIYRCNNINYSSIALEKINDLISNGFGNLPVCIAKTQYSFSDNAKLVGAPNNFDIFVNDINLYNGAGFVTVLLGDIMTMPGLPKVPNYEKIDFVDNEIIGLS